MRTKHEQESISLTTVPVDEIQILDSSEQGKIHPPKIPIQEHIKKGGENGKGEEKEEEEQGTQAPPTSWQVSGEDAHARTWSMAVLLL